MPNSGVCVFMPLHVRASLIWAADVGTLLFRIFYFRPLLFGSQHQRALNEVNVDLCFRFRQWGRSGQAGQGGLGRQLRAGWAGWAGQAGQVRAGQTGQAGQAGQAGQV